MPRVRATYETYVYFKIPKHINLNDENQVEEYGVKWNILYIKLRNGELLKIEEDFTSEDFKFPLKVGIDSDIEDTDDEDEDIENEE